MITTFTVAGMTCGGCVRGVTNAIRRIDENAVVDVDLPGKTVSVNSSVEAELLMRAIETAGFKVSR